MSFDVERLYTLLPAIYRVRDAEQDGALKELLSVIAEQVAVLEENLAQLYDDQFIETCAEWVVPYIGDLVGARDLYTLTKATFSRRAQVANTLAYRRRKGTAAVLEQLARDVTGWDARVVEFFQLLATTQYMNHLRPGNLYAPDLRQGELLEHLNTPFDGLAHTADVRRITSGRGKYNIPNVGIFLWRLNSYSLTNSPAFKVKVNDPSDRRYLFSPLGNDTRLYNLAQTEDQITHLAEPVNVAMPVSRRVLDRYPDVYYGQSLILKLSGGTIARENIVVCDLSDIEGDKWSHMPEKKYAIDPELGRIALPENVTANVKVTVTFHYGFSAHLGGGEYGRASSFTPNLQPVEKVPSPQTKIQNALAQVKRGGVVEITDSGRYEETPSVQIVAGKHLELRAANKRRPTLVLGNEFKISGGKDAQLTLNGLLISGGTLRVEKGSKLRKLCLRHCTLVPGLTLSRTGSPQHRDTPSLIVEAANTTVLIEKCIVGGLRVVEGARVWITNSIVDATAETGVAYAAPGEHVLPGGTLRVENCTIIGKVYTRLMELASNTIFLAELAKNGVWTKAPVQAERRQEGCVRFCYLPLASLVPRRYRCQPAEAAQAARVRPQFNSLRYGDAEYCQLSQRCAVEIRQGADDEAEMGVYQDLYQPQREINLRMCLDEYLRFGLETGIFYAS
jgi:hypothetical protein